MATTEGARSYLPNDRFVFLSLDDEAYTNFNALLPLLLGSDGNKAQWQTKYYSAFFSWHLRSVVQANLRSAIPPDDGTTLYVVGFSSLSTSAAQELNEILLANAPILLIHFQAMADVVDNDIDAPDLDLSLDQELFTFEVPQRDKEQSEAASSKTEDHWRSQVDFARKNLPLGSRDPQNDSGSGLRSFVEFLDVFDWRSRRSNVGLAQSYEEVSDTRGVATSDSDEDSFMRLERILGQIEQARAGALSGVLSDERRRETASELISKLMSVLDLGSLDL